MNNLQNAAVLAASIMMTTENSYPVVTRSVLVKAMYNNLVREDVLQPILSYYLNRFGDNSPSGALALMSVAEHVIKTLTRAETLTAAVEELVTKPNLLHTVADDALQDFLEAIELLEDHTTQFSVNAIPVRVTSVNHEDTSSAPATPQPAPRPAPQPTVSTGQATSASYDGWIKSGLYVNLDGQTEDLNSKDHKPTPESVIATCIFMAVKALEEGNKEAFLALLESLPSQVGKMLKIINAAAGKLAKDESAKNLTEEWTSTLESVDALYQENDIRHLIGTTIKNMAAVQGGFYPPLSTMIQVLGKAVDKATDFNNK